MTYTLGMAARAVTQNAMPSDRGEVALRHARLEAEIAASLQVNADLCQQLRETRLDRERWRRPAQQLVATLPVAESYPRPRLTAPNDGACVDLGDATLEKITPPKRGQVWEERSLRGAPIDIGESPRLEVAGFPQGST
jgi:hypothetical protein